MFYIVFTVAQTQRDARKITAKVSASSTPKRKRSMPSPKLKGPLLSLEQDLTMDSSIYEQYTTEKQQIKELLKKVSDAKKKALESDSDSESEDVDNNDEEDEFQISFKQDSDVEQLDNIQVSDEELVGDNNFLLEDDDDVIDLGQDSDIDQGFETDNEGDLSRLEDVQEVISETSTAFDRVVKHIMTKQGYQGQPVSSDRPSTLSAPATKSVPLARFPTNPYVARKLTPYEGGVKVQPCSYKYYR